MSDKLEFVHRLTGFLAGLDRPPTTADVRRFVASLDDTDRERFLVALLLDGVAGLTPPATRRAPA